MASLSDRYSPQNVEKKLYPLWEQAELFKAEEVSTKPPFSMILPPPNVTGFLHLGHALNSSIQDVLARWKRMQGYNVLWLPGTDHAGIATQGVVEKELAKEGLRRQDLGREKFLERVWEWKHKYGTRIVNQMKSLGASCDWSRFCFTLDDNVSRAVRRVFVSLYKKGLIYKGTKLINWSPKLESAISDLEVEYKEVKGHLWHIKYPLENKEGFITVATTRPETLLGDMAVAVHPSDERYKKWVGKNLLLPLTNRKIPIITDEHVDKEFGSGAVKITPAHDFNDYEMGLRHGLEMLNILNKDGTLNENAGKYQGLSVQQARQKVLEDLQSLGLLEKEESHTHSVGHCSRSGCVVEPFLSQQWFIKMKELATPARHVVENGSIVFEPESWVKTYLHWLNNIQDWCISRQLWWGHQIPAWICQDCGHINVAEEEPSSCEKCQSSHLQQEEDVLDTWFSSALWPFSTMGWPEETELQKTFYPTNVLVTAHDIIFFWVARMIMMGLEFKKDVPFRTVYIHGLIRDSQGRKMSKSLNNSIDPIKMIEKYGADALRLTLLSQIASGKDLKFSEKRIEGYRNFMNKIWNASRFAIQSFEGENFLNTPPPQELATVDRWIIAKLAECEQKVQENLSAFRFSDAVQTLYAFIWHELCDWYLELIKPIIYGKNLQSKKTSQKVLFEVLLRSLKLLHPFAPFITEEIFQTLTNQTSFLMEETFPTPKTDKEWLQLGDESSREEVDFLKDIIVAIRNIRGENRIKPGKKIEVFFNTNNTLSEVLQNNALFIENLAQVGKCHFQSRDLSKCALSVVYFKNEEVQIIVPLEGLVDIKEEIERLKKQIEKTQKELQALSQKLNNKNFIEKAPPEVILNWKDQQKITQGRLEQMQASLKRLQQ